MRIRGLVVASVVAVSGGLLAHAQISSGFRSESNYVEVDAIVTDAHGDVVRGLTAADFVVKEDGKKQSIASFDVVDLPASGPAATGAAPRFAPNVSDDLRTANGRVYLLYLAASPAMTNAVARQAAEFVEKHLQPNDVAAVWSIGSAGGPIAFSSDRTTLLATITACAATSQPPGANPAVAPPGLVTGTPASWSLPSQRLTDAVASLDAIQGRRKSLILFTESATSPVEQCMSALLGSPMQGVRVSLPDGSRLPGGQPLNIAPGRGANGNANAALAMRTSWSCASTSWMATVATEPSVRVYSVEASGAVSAEQASASLKETNADREFQNSIDSQPRTGMPSSSTDWSGRAFNPTTPVPAPDLPSGTTLAPRIQSIAESKGNLVLATGKNVAPTGNDFKAGFGKIVQDNSTYYVLGYDSTNARGDGKFHEISISTVRGGLTVRARKGYLGR